MSRVTNIYYEIVGDGTEKAAGHVRAIHEQRERCWAFVQEVDGSGFRPARHAPLDTVMFRTAKAPSGWRKVAKVDDEQIECRPSATHLGKEYKKRINAIGTPPTGGDIAACFGWNPSTLVMDGMRIFFPTFQHLIFPKLVYLLGLPRSADDGWKTHPDLREMKMSEVHEVFEAHNAQVRANDEADETAA